MPNLDFVNTANKQLSTNGGLDFIGAAKSGKSFKLTDESRKKLIEDNKIILRTQDGTVFGKVTYDAYKAIEGNTLDSYTPYDDEEKKAIEAYKEYTRPFVYGNTVGSGATRSFGDETQETPKNSLPTIDGSTGKANTDITVKDKYGEGNIDLANRPIYVNPDGKISTVASMSINEDGIEILIPTIVRDENGNAKKLSENEAIEHYHKTGEYLGKFNTVEEADEYANSLHIDQDKYYSTSVPLSIEVDGETKDFGKISIGAYYALTNNSLDNYTPINEEEKQSIANYTKFAEEYAKKQREPENFWQGLGHSFGYTLENIGAGAVDGISEVARYGGALIQTALRPFTWGSWNKALKDSTEELLNEKTYGDMWKESAESRYRVPDWYRNTMGGVAYNLGSLAPAMVAEVVTKGASPMLEQQMATNAMMAGATRGTASAVASNVAKALIKPKASDFMFGMSAAGNAAHEGYKMTGDVGSSLRYGALNGLGEVATEKLFGGLAGTGIGVDDAIFDVTKIKGLSKIASTKFGKKVLDIAFEGVEEEIMTLADPLFQKLTVNPDLDVADAIKNAPHLESMFQGILLSGLMNAGTATVNKANKLIAIKKLNAASEGINAIMQNDADKLVPLKHNSTIEEIQQRQREINVFTTAYADLMVEELVKNNPETFAHIEKTSVGDTFKDTKTGYTITVVARDDKNTTVEIDTGTKTISKVFSNNQADAFATSDQMVEIETSATESDTAQTSTTTPQSISVGDTFVDAATGQTMTVVSRDAKNTVVEIVDENGKTSVKPFATKRFDRGIASGQIVNPNAIATETATTDVAPTTTSSVKVGDVYEADGKTYTITGRENGRTTYTITDENGNVTTREVSNVVADINFTKEDAYTKVQEGTETDTITDEEVAVVVDAMNETFEDGAKEAIFKSMENKGLTPDISVFAEQLSKAYKKHGQIGDVAKFFTDGGAKVIAAIEGKVDVAENTTTTKTAVEEKSDSLFIDDRSYDDVSSRKVKAFQYEHPEVQPFYKAIANELRGDVKNTIKGERFVVGDFMAGTQQFMGTKRFTSEAIARIKDMTGATYDEIDNALQRIINDEGQENIALAKKIELVIDDMLSDGYKSFDGTSIEANEEYLALKEQLKNGEYDAETMSKTDVVDKSVDNAPTTTEETTADSGVELTDDNIAVVAKAITDTASSESKNLIENDDTLNSMAMIFMQAYNDGGTLQDYAQYFTDGGQAVASAIEGIKKKDGKSAEVLQNEQESDMDEDGEMYSVSSPKENESLEIKSNLEYNGNTNYSREDTDYLKAVESGDMETAQKMVDEAAETNGYNIRAYHGTSRADRVGNVFLPERATSGPMAFFTDNKDIAEGYSKSKRDTSMAYDPDYDSYETQFRIKIKDRDIPLYRAWGYLPFDARSRITKKAQQLRENWDGDNEFILDPDNREANGGFQWQLKEARGNTLLALNEQWLNSGNLFNQESRFLEVLEMTGVMEEFKKIGLDSIYFKDPNARHEKVYDTYLRITKPFDTSLADNSFVDELISWYEEQDESKYSRESMESDLWDKNSIDAYEFADRVRSDIENGTFHAWTSIPDSVTDYLKSLDYDGIKDLGGKNSDVGHTVWIPFSSNQIKSAEPVTYDNDGNVIPLSERFNEQDNDIRYSVEDYAPTFYSHMGKVIDEIKQDKIGANSVVNYLKGKGVKDEEVKWSGIETFLDGKKSVTKAELQEFVAGSMLQIEEQELGETIKYTDEQQRQLDRIDTDKRHLWDGVYELWDELLPNTDLFDFMATDNTITMLSRIANAVKKSEKADTEDANRLLGYLDEIDSLELELRRIVAQAKASGQNTPKWSEYKLDGGENYREIVFKIPNSTYTNESMRTHWGEDAQGILAHARVQDMTTADGKKMLFIEEIQSDWHNAGQKEGYLDKSLVVTMKNTSVKHEDGVYRLYRGTREMYENVTDAFLKNRFPNGITEEEIHQGLVDQHNRLLENTVPDAPFRDNYHEYVLKSLIRMAAEQGYDSIGWTPADVQSKRWSGEFAEGYRIEYDQDIPKFLNKYGKKWGAKVGKTPMEIDGETETTYYTDDSGNRSGSYSKLIDDILARRGVNEAEFNDYHAVFVDDETIKIRNPQDGSYLDEEIHLITEPSSVWSMPITDSMKDSVLYEGQPLYSVESEANNNEQRRNDLLSGNGRRGNNESARKWSERISSFKQKNKGKNAKERQNFAKELLEQGKAEEVIDGKNKYTLVNPEAYNDDMLAMVEEAKAKGIELGFFLGEAKIKFDTKDEFKVNGIKKSGSKLLVRYDGKVTPQKLLKHETVHVKWRTKAMQSVKNTILNSLSEDEKNAILSQDRYAYYKKVYKGNMDKVWQEFVADVMADMNNYTAKHIDAVADYWYGNESVEGYNPSTYAESIDAGGKVASGNVEYTLSESGESNEIRTDNIGRTDSVSNGDRNSGRGSKSGRQNVPDGTAKSSDKDVNSRLDFKVGKKPEGSYSGSVGRLLENSKVEKKTSGSRTDGRRFLEALEANDDTTARELLNKKALERGYTPVNVYHGTDADVVFTKFENDNAIWVSTTEEYASKYAADYFGEHSYLFGKDSGVYDLYIKKEKVLDVGDIDTLLDTPTKLHNFGNKIGFTEQEIQLCWNAGRKYETNKAWAITNTSEFAEIARQYGYDTLQAIEGKDKAVTYGVLYRNNLKSAKLRTFDKDGNIIPLEERFSEDDDIQYSLADDGILDLEDLWTDAIEKYGKIPKGEKPARDVDVPKKISEEDVVSQFARTVLEAGVTPEWAVSELETAILNGELTHEVIPNQKAHGSAIANIKKLGFKGAMDKWDAIMKSEGSVNEVDFAMGLELYNQCVTNKDTRNAMKLVADLCAEATRSARNLQLVRLLKKMTPDGQLYYLEKSIQRMNEEFKDKLGDKFKDIELDEGLMEEFLNETDETKRNAIYDKICQQIADQIPTTLKDKWDSWRYLAMLGNPRTHIRNLTGNAVFVPAIRMKDFIAATIESGLEKAGKMDASERTKSFKKSEEAKAFAKKDSNIKEVEKLLQGINAKYAITGDIESKRTIFKNKLLEWARTKNFDVLETVDMKFLKFHYANALSRLITVRNLDVNSLDAKTLDKIRQIAVKEAQRATFRDANYMAEALSATIGKLKKSGKWGNKAFGYILEGIQPFVKTPMNIAKQGVYYSPAGLVVGAINAYKMKKGADITIADVVDDFSKGLTGTLGLLVGYILSSLGILKGGDDEDKKKQAFDEMVGEQSYSLNIGDWSYTIDWMIPSSISFFVGNELYNLTRDEFSAADVLNAMSKLTDPLLELSVFSGYNKAIKAANYSDINPIISVMVDAFASYLTQGLPTIGGQMSRLIDKNKREYYYIDKTSDMPVLFQRLIGQASSKIPFVSYLYAPSVDEWGRDEEYGGLMERAFENTISPGYYSKENYTEVDKELQRLYETVGDSSVLPITQQKYLSEDNLTRYLTADEHTEVKKIRGQKSFQLISELMADEKTYRVQDDETDKYKKLKYSQMSDKQKVKVISDFYKDAGEYAKAKYYVKVYEEAVNSGDSSKQKKLDEWNKVIKKYEPK